MSLSPTQRKKLIILVALLLIVAVVWFFVLGDTPTNKYPTLEEARATVATIKPELKLADASEERQRELLQAIHALGSYDDLSSSPRLIELVAHSDPQISDKAIASLGTLYERLYKPIDRHASKDQQKEQVDYLLTLIKQDWIDIQAMQKMKKEEDVDQ